MRLALRVLGLVLLVFAAAAAGCYVYLRQSLPLTRGEIALPGLGAPVEVLRDGATKSMTVQLKEFPRNELASSSRRGNDDGGSEAEETLKGVAVGNIDGRAREQLNIPSNLKGAIVTDIDESSAAFEAGLRQGDVILEINRKPVASADDAVELSAKNDKKGSVLLRVWSRGGTRYVVVKEDKQS